MLHSRIRGQRLWDWSRIGRWAGTAILALSLTACGTGQGASTQFGSNSSPAAQASPASSTPSTAGGSPAVVFPARTFPGCTFGSRLAAQASPRALATPNVEATPATECIVGTSAYYSGTRGAYSWAFRATDFLLTADGGTHWTSTPLPAGVGTLSVDATVGPSGALWLMTNDGDHATFYQAAGPNQPWQKTNVILDWPSKPQGAAKAASADRGVKFGSSVPGLISAVVSSYVHFGNDIGTTVSLLLLSTDGGRTFQQHVFPLPFSNAPLAFTSATNGVFLAFGDQGKVDYTANGGASWHPANLPIEKMPLDSSLGEPTVAGSRIYMPANVPELGTSRGSTPTSEKRLNQIYVSDDGGATFKMLASFPVVSPYDTSVGLTLGVDGSTIWAMSGTGGVIHESIDNGKSWKTVPTLSTWGYFITSAGIKSSNKATIWLFDVNDATTPYGGVLLVTTDGGRHWRQMSVPLQP